MGYSSNVYKTAADRLFERRLNAEKDADRRRAQIYQKLPVVKELEYQISSSGVRAARAVLGGENVVEHMQRLQDENLALQSELDRVLKSNGYSGDALEPHYFCSKCNDTGYIEENGKTIVCTCLKQMLISCACEELNRTAPLSLSTFDAFSLDYYSKEADSTIGISPYNQMQRILKFCMDYAAGFTPHSQSILMKGSTGLGKTHLSLAIANEIIKKGFGVIYVSAPSLTQQFEKLFRTKNQEDYSLINMLIDCDLLIVDDLGTELQSKYYLSQIYNIFNSRMLSNKPIIINTNLTLRELEKDYSERFVSRICGNAQRLDFIGSDIRVRKK